MIEIMETTIAHLNELKDNLRDDDRKEIACFGISDFDALFHSWQNSLICKVAIVEGQVAGVWGVIGCMWEGVGCPWILTAPICNKYPLPFALLYRQEMLKFHRIFPVLENYTDATYEKSLKLMEIMGFTLYDAEPHGPIGGMFRKVRRVAA